MGGNARCRVVRARGGGCGSSKVGPITPVYDPSSGAPPQPVEQQLPLTALTTEDPRWDRAGFEAFVAGHAPFVKVRFLRELASAASIAPASLTFEAVPQKELHKQLPKDCGVAGIGLFAVLSPSLLMVSPDPVAELKAILELLREAADDDDLVYWPHMCSVRSGVTATAARKGIYRMFTHYRVQTVIVTKLKLAEHSIFERLETMAYLSLAGFCQRLVNASDEDVREGIDLEKLMDLPNTLAGLQCDGFDAFTQISEMLEDVIRKLKPVATDEVGFRVLCEESQIAWVRVPYLKKLAARGGPCPRRQDLDPKGLIVGVPKGRKVSLSHGWDSSYHISPTGEKLKLLVEELTLLGINDNDDGVFIDFTSLWQRAPEDMPEIYLTQNKLTAPLVGRTPVMEKQFYYALWEMSRLYSFKDVTVIVLPQQPKPERFPVGPDAWGLINPDAYEFRGWTTSEYSISKFCGRIGNTSSDAVQILDATRVWPTSVPEYIAMMDPNAEPRPIQFTKKGDKEVVTFLFYRVCYGMLHTFLPEEWQKARRWQLPEVSKLAAAESLPIGSGDAERKYYMHVAIQPPPAIAGDRMHANALRDLQTALLTQEEMWDRQRKYPVVFSDASTRCVSADLNDGNVHSLVWSAPGSGWEGESGKAPSVAVDTLCEMLSKLAPEKRPKAVFLCMPFGPKGVAERIANTGVPVVAWIRESLLENGAAVLLGIVSPMLDLLATPRARGMVAANLTGELRGLGRQIFGSRWEAAGVILHAPPLQALPVWQPKHSSLCDIGGPWVHSINSNGESWFSAPAAVAVPDELYEAIKLVTLSQDTGKPVDLLTCASPKDICAWLEDTLPAKSNQKAKIMALYADEDSDGNPATQARVLISSVGFLHELRDVALTGQLDATLSVAPLIESRGLVVRIDRAQFCRMYEGSVLSLDKLTEHQIAKLEECLAAESKFIHLKAPAGAGKTFVAMHRLLKLMQDDPDALVLFVARNVALCYFVVRWLARRVSNTLQRLKLIKRLFILFDPLYDGPRAITVRHGRIELSTETPSKSFSLVVVDESHHIYANPQLKNCVESHVTPTTQRLLISDVSQSLGWEIDYPKENVAEVVLTEVVRSTQRIVAGAAAFQLGDKKLLTGNAHNATGPPLKTFVFDVPRKVEAARNPSVYAEAREKAYVEHTVKALKHVSTTLGALDLHDRVAIVMPSEESAEIIRKPLESAVGDAFPMRPYKLLDARQAATIVADTGENADSDAWLILDSIENFDGLERLVVICVDLDTVIEQSDALQTRSLIYRAMTRAHMLVVVVNEFLQGGWLAFMRTLKLEAEAKQKAKAETSKGETKPKNEMHARDRKAVDRTTTAAKVSAVLREKDAEAMAEAAVAAVLTKAIELSLTDAGLPLLDEHIIAHTPSVLSCWHTLLDMCGPAVDSALLKEKKGLQDESTRKVYMLEAAFTVVHGADGRLTASDGPELAQKVQEAAEVAVSGALGWRTPAFVARCRAEMLAQGLETSDLEWAQGDQGGSDLTLGVHRRMMGDGLGRTKTDYGVSFEEAIAGVKRTYEQVRHIIESKGLESAVEEEVIRRIMITAGQSDKSDHYLREMCNGYLESFQAEQEASLGVMSQLVWDVESTSQAELGEIKFTPYPIEKKKVEWLDPDGDSTGYELEGGKMYLRENNMRKTPLGPAHIVRYAYNPATGNHAVRDSRGFGFSAYYPIPDDKYPEVQAMWDIAKKNLGDAGSDDDDSVSGEDEDE